MTRSGATGHPSPAPEPRGEDPYSARAEETIGDALAAMPPEQVLAGLRDLPGEPAEPLYLAPLDSEGIPEVRMPLHGGVSSGIRHLPDGRVVAGIVIGRNKGRRYVLEFGSDQQIDEAVAALLQAKDERARELAMEPPSVPEPAFIAHAAVMVP